MDISIVSTRAALLKGAQAAADRAFDLITSPDQHDTRGVALLAAAADAFRACGGSPPDQPSDPMVTTYREYLDAYLTFKRGKADTLLIDQQHTPDETLAMRCIAAHDATTGQGPKSRAELKTALERLLAGE